MSDPVRESVKLIGREETGAMMRLILCAKDAGAETAGAGAQMLRDAGLINVIDGTIESGEYVLRVTPKGMRVARGEIHVKPLTGRIEVCDGQ